MKNEQDTTRNKKMKTTIRTTNTHMNNTHKRIQSQPIFFLLLFLCVQIPRSPTHLSSHIDSHSLYVRTD